MSKHQKVYRIIKRRGTIYDWLYQVQVRTSAERRFLFFFFEEEWKDVGSAEVSFEKAKDAISHMTKYGGSSVVYRSDLDDVTEKALLDE